MNKAARWILLSILLLGLTSLACQTLLGGDDQDSDVLVTEPTQEPASVTTPEEPTSAPTQAAVEVQTAPSPTEAVAVDAFDLANTGLFGLPQDAKNLAINLTISYEEVKDDLLTSGRIVVEGLQVFEPAASSYNIAIEGEDALAAEGFTIVDVEGSSYVVLPDGSCFGGDAGGTTETFTDLLEVQGFLGGQAEQIESGVTVNGTLADRYGLDESNIQSWDAISGSDFVAEEASIAIARDGGYLLQLIISGTGTDSLLSDEPIDKGSFTYELNLTPGQEAIDISVPDGCSAQSTDGSEFPMLADAFDINTFPGTTIYSTLTTVEDAAAFYRDEMQAADWSIDQEFSAGDLVTFSFSKDGQNVQILVSKDVSSGNTLVSIIEL